MGFALCFPSSSPSQQGHTAVLLPPRDAVTWKTAPNSALDWV